MGIFSRKKQYLGDWYKDVGNMTNAEMIQAGNQIQSRREEGRKTKYPDDWYKHIGELDGAKILRVGEKMERDEAAMRAGKRRAKHGIGNMMDEGRMEPSHRSHTGPWLILQTGAQLGVLPSLPGDLGGAGSDYDCFAPLQFGVPSMPRGGPLQGPGTISDAVVFTTSCDTASARPAECFTATSRTSDSYTLLSNYNSSMQAQAAQSVRIPIRPGKIRDGERLPTGVVDPIATTSSHEFGHHGLREHLPGMTHLDIEDSGRADDPQENWKLLEDIQRLGLGGGGKSKRSAKRTGGGPENRKGQKYTHGPR
ncbi:hypothetical protein DE146DRAFT_635692 [Phaeosphaeria sp. MPI-PUGE-AT-0046c]|nr:hypothetical protein DE146DRAFT_635692 [Phaeosphaeria sp. MPI-PUGE-AT-0046c]